MNRPTTMRAETMEAYERAREAEERGAATPDQRALLVIAEQMEWYKASYLHHEQKAEQLRGDVIRRDMEISRLREAGWRAMELVEVFYQGASHHLEQITQEEGYDNSDRPIPEEEDKLHG